MGSGHAKEIVNKQVSHIVSVRHSESTVFDYIIVGAGSAGCVLANKLGANTNANILLVEAGPMDRDLLIHVPAGVYSAWRNPKLNWNYHSEPEVHMHDREVFTPRGKVVGGSSSINSMVYMRGHPKDYDRWASEHGLSDWQFDRCLPYFKAGETSDRGASNWRGGSGLLGVSQAQFDNPLYDAFIESGRQAGQGYSEDLNGFNPHGVARLDATRKNGRRCSAAVAFLKPALKRGNITLLTHASVERVLIDGDKAVGVCLLHKGQAQRVYCDKEVVLSGGAINTPQLLMLSGIGPADHLSKFGIDVLINSPDVGQNLQDHPCIILTFESTKQFPIHKVDSPLHKAGAGLRWVFTRKGMAASNIWEAGGLINSKETVDYPDLQYHFGPVGFEYIDNKIKLSQAFSIHVDVLRPRSRGSVNLRSEHAQDKPQLNFNYYVHVDDLNDMVNGVKRTRELVAQAAFKELCGAPINPGIHVRTDEQIKQWILQNSETDFHPCGTCRMGVDDTAVVDEQMRVRGCRGLRVVDASVLPSIVSGNLNAPIQMIAARAADYILGRQQLAAEKVQFQFD